MRITRGVRILFFLILLPVLAHAQYQASFVTMTGTNANYPGGTMTANFLPPANSSQFDYLKYHFPFTVSAPLDGSGHWSMSLADTSSVLPANSQWRLQMCSSAQQGFAPPTCYQVITPVTCISNPSCSGSTLDLTASFAAAPAPASGSVTLAGINHVYSSTTYGPGTITLISTTFNEGTAGAPIIGTQPAVNLPGNTWIQWPSLAG